MHAEIIAATLGGRKAGRGWIARCPAHDDREPSVSIRDADGKALGSLSCRPATSAT
jgi:putative DNA primase/helicase